MPRDGSNVYSADWVNAAPNTTIESAKQNAMVADFVADANAARPITAGGTGETTARLKDGTWRFQNTADTSKLLAFDLSGLTTATTRTIAIPDNSGTLLISTAQALSATEAARVRLNQGMVNTVLQQVVATYATNTDLTAAIPFDDTIPQTTEGTHVITQVFTPLFDNSKIYLRFSCTATANTGPSGVAAYIGVSGVANALSASRVTIPAVNYVMPITIDAEYASGATSAITFVAAIGSDGSNTVRLNGTPTGRIFGGASKATLTITEIAQ